MLTIKNLKIALIEENKQIVNGINLTINAGEVHYINGNNGSGKSTIVNFLMGNPQFKSTEGEVILHLNQELDKDPIIDLIDKDSFIDSKTINILETSATERSLLGFFLANQYPVEIPGVSLRNYLRLIYNVRLPKDKKASVFEFKKILNNACDSINYPTHLLDRNLNDGFSGGEKKKTEILQMLLLKPKYVFLDEIDSGLDRNALKDVFSAINLFRQSNTNTAFIVISHYDNVQNYLIPDHIHIMQNGSFL